MGVNVRNDLPPLRFFVSPSPAPPPRSCPPAISQRSLQEPEHNQGQDLLGDLIVYDVLRGN